MATAFVLVASACGSGAGDTESQGEPELLQVQLTADTDGKEGMGDKSEDAGDKEGMGDKSEDAGDKEGMGDKSEEAMPGAPTDVMAAPRFTEATITWKSGSEGRCPTTGYAVRVLSYGDMSEVVATSPQLADTSWYVSGLSSDTKYRVEVWSFGDCGPFPLGLGTSMFSTMALPGPVDFEELNRTQTLPRPMLPPPPGQVPGQSFDNFISGSALWEVVVPNVAPFILQDLSHPQTPGGDASLVHFYVTSLMAAAFDAMAPYHETAVGMYSRFERRPEEEGQSNLLPNEALLYVVYRVMLEYAPHRAQQWRGMLAVHGLNPDNNIGMDQDCFDNNATTPAAIGNLAAKCFLEGRQNDGFNAVGQETPGMPFADTTGYMPVNTAYELKDPSRWQPLIERLRVGNYRIQHYVTPQYANVQPYSGIDPRSVRVPSPTASNHMNEEAYKAQADEVLEISRNLTDEQKMYVEYFDNKVRDAIFLPWVKNEHNVVKHIQLEFLVHMAAWDAGIIAWQEKTRYDAVRPVTAINYLYPDLNWKSYAPASDHPEYPSATTIFCAAYGEAARLYTGSDEIKEGDFVGMLPPGFSRLEPGTPKAPVTLKFDSWTDYVNKCGESRLWGGVHFRAAVDASLEVGTGIGEHAYEYFKSLMDGEAPPRKAAVPLDPDPMLDGPSWTGR
ncbi:DUF6851 domain-containing protein [Candidatus Poriferisocius sp.]|uniref:DUF6851 domain-containing protein n=1 Tax=Candidatus Poriferisocius sp. TaxID=3101276 RepID=UPI003B02E109